MNKKHLFLVCVTVLLIASLAITTAADNNTQTNKSVTKKTDNTHTMNNIQSNKVKSNSNDNSLDTSKQTTKEKIDESHTSSENQINTDTTTSIEEKEKTVKNSINKKTNNKTVKGVQYVTVDNFSDFKYYVRYGSDTSLVITIAENANFVVTDSSNYWPSGSNVMNLTIIGNGVTINGNGHRFLTIGGDKDRGIYRTLNMTNLTIENCSTQHASENRGSVLYGIHVPTIYISHCTFNNCSAGDDGGAILVHRGNLTITDSKFNDISARTNSGAIRFYYNDEVFNNAFMYIRNVTFTNVSSGDNGGVIYAATQKGNVDIINCTFKDSGFNQTSANTPMGAAIFVKTTKQLNLDGNVFENFNSSGKGVIYIDTSLPVDKHVFNNLTFNNITMAETSIIHVVSSTNVTVTDCTFTNNNATNGGGVITLLESVSGSYIYNNTFINNTAKYGAAIYTSGVVTSVNNTFANNNATLGGAVYTFSNTAKFNGYGDIYENNTALRGGAVYVTENANVESNRGYFKNNTASEYGGVTFVENGGVFDTNYDVFEENSAIRGGVLYVNGSSGKKIVVSYSNFTKNNATEGGALYIEQGIVDSESEIFKNNHADIGGAIYNLGGNLFSTSNILVNNTADIGGGAYVAQGASITKYYGNDENNSALIGGAIYNNGTFVSQGSKFTTNNATTGGAVFNNGTLSITNDLFTRNNASLGGAIYNNNTINANNNNFIGNNATNGGGLLDNGTFSGNGNNYYNNTALENGGAVYSVHDRSINLKTVRFEGNTAGINGGAIFAEENITLSSSNDVRYLNNSAVLGGAVYLSNNCTFDSYADEFRANNATYGGAIFAQANNTVSIRGASQVDSNTAEKGGAIYLNETSNLNMVNSFFTNNNATEGSVVYANSGNNVTSSGSTYENNTATTGTIYLNENVVFTSSNDKFINNVATDKGGAIYTKSNITTSNDVFDSNNATFGGAIYLEQNLVYDSLKDTFESNHATISGGALYVEDNSVVNVTEDMFDLNNAVNGGAIFIVGNSNFNSTRTTYRKNDAEEGGAVYVPEEAEVNTTGDEFDGNNATVGGVFYNIGTINSTGSTYSNSNSTDKGSVVYNAPQATFVSENDQFKSNDGVKGSVIYNDGKATVTQSIFDSNKAVNSVIYNDNELTLNNTNFKGNYITGMGNYVIFNNKDTVTIVNSLFVNNTNDTHDILLGGVQPANIRDNTYIDNYLNDTMTVPELIDVDPTQAPNFYNMTVNLRSIYNDTIRNGTITFKDAEGNNVGEGIVNNGNATVTIFTYRLSTGRIPVNVTYKSFDKHYQDINLTTTIVNPGPTSVVVTGIDPTYVDDKFNATVSLYNSTFGYIYNQNVTVYINGTKYVGNTTDKGYFIIEDLSFNRYGVYPINATFDGTNLLTPSSVNTSITIMKIPTHLVLNLPENITHPDDTGIINVTLYDSRSNTALANKNITLNITYKELYTSTSNETGSINYTFVAYDRGNIDVLAFAPIENDVKYATPDEVMGRFVINRYSPHFHFTVTQIEHPEVANDVNITFTLYDEYHNLITNKNVTLYIQNSTGNFEVNVTTNATGEILLKQTVLANGDVNVTAVSVENYKYREGSLPVHVQADIIYTFLAVIPSNTYVNNSNEIVIHFQDISGESLNGKINLTVGEYDPVEVDIENGVITYKNDSMTWNHAQEVRVSVSFAGNNTHQVSSSNATFTVFRIPTNTTIAVLQNLNTESIFEINVTANQTIYSGNVNYGTITIYANKTIDDQTTELITLAEELSLVGTDGHIIFSTDKLEDITRYRIIVQYNKNDVFFESSAITAMGTTSYKNTTITITATSPILVNQTDTMEFVLRETQNNNRLPFKNITITVKGPDGYIRTYENLTTDDLGRVLVDARFENVGIYNITATFDGDVYYNKTVSLANITVRQKTITIVSVVSPIHVYDNITCIVTLTDISGYPLAKQFVYVTDNDREKTFITNDSGQFAVEDIYYTSGLKNITATFMGTELYITSEGYDIILVQRLDTILSVKADSPVYVGNQTVISGYLTLANGTGIKGQKVNLTINGQYSIPIVTGEDGNYTYNYTTKPNEIGINNVTVEFKQDDVYYGFVDKTVFMVDNIITIITVDADRLLKVGNTTNITGVLVDQFGNRLLRQDIDLYINGEKVDQRVGTNNNGEYYYTFTPKTAGIYNIVVNYTGNTTHRDSHANYRIKVDKIITHMDLYSTTPINIGDKINVNGKLYDEFDQPLIRATVSLLVNGTYIKNTTTLTDGTFSFTYDTTTVGIQNITVVYNGTEEKYLPTNNTHQSNVLKIFTHFDEVEATNVKVDQNTTVTGILIDENGLPMNKTSFNITFNDGEQLNYTTDDNGRFIIYYNATVVGLNNLTLNYYGSETHTPVSLDAVFNVEKLDVYLDTNVTELHSRNATLTINLTDENGVQVTEGFIFIYDENDVEIGNATVPPSGKVTVTVPVTPGLHNIQVFYNGTEDRYKTSNQDVSLNVPKHVLNLTLEKINDTKVRNTTNITGFLYDLDNNPVEGRDIQIYVNGELKATVQTGKDGNYTYVYTAEISGLNEARVVFVGDDDNATVEKTGTFTVEKINTTIVLNQIDDTTVDYNITVTGILKDEFEFIIPDVEVIISINGINYTNITGSNGEFSFVYTTSVIGINNVTVYYNGNNTYNNTQSNTTFTVNPHTTNVTVPEIANTTIGKTVLINGTLTDELGQVVANVEVIITVNGKNYTASTDADGKYAYNYTTGMAGENSVTVTFVGNKNIIGTSNSTTFNVTKILTNTTANITSPRAGTNVIDINVNETISGLNVTNGALEVRNETDDVIATGQVINGTAVITVGNLVSGQEYEFKVVYNGTNIYENSSYTFKVTIPNSKISIVPDPVNTMKIGEYIDITGMLVDENNKPVANTLVNVTVDGNKLEVRTNDSGRYAYPYTANKTGNITVNVTVEQEGYDTASVEFNFTVVPLYTRITANATSPIIVTNNTTISGVLSDEYGVAISGVNVTVYINGAEVGNATTGTDGSYTYNYTTGVLGLNNVVVKYAGNATHAESNATSNFIVEQMFTAISVQTVTPIKVGNNTTITGILTDRNGQGIAGQKINISIGNDEYAYNTTTGADGKYSINVLGELEGTYDVKVLFNGTEVYMESNNTAKFTVEKYNVNIGVNITEPKAGKNTVNLNLTDEYGNPVTEGNVTLLDKDGNFLTNATLTETGLIVTEITLEPGLQNITVVYNGTNKYKEANTTYVVNIPKYNATLTLENVNDTIVRNTTNITGFLLDGETPMEGSIVDILINGIVVGNATIKADGSYTYVYDATMVGDKNVTVLYKGTDKYASTSVNDTFNVGPIHTNVTVPEIANTTIGKTVLINGTLTDELGQVVANVEVIITVNGKNYTASTDADGKYAYNYTTGMAGENSVTVTFVGDNNILGTSNATTFNVTKIPTTTKANITIPRVGTNVIEINVTETTGGLNVTNGPIIIMDEDGNILTTGVVFNGTSVVTVPGLIAGRDYSFTVVYNGTNIYENSSYKFDVTIPMSQINIIPDPVNPMKMGDSTEITGRLVDEKNNPLGNTKVNVTVNGERRELTTDGNGKYSYPYIANKTGNNTVNVTVEQEGYDTASVEYNFTVDKVFTQVTVDATTPIIVTNNTTINGVLTDEYGHAITGAKVTIIINGENVTNVTTGTEGNYTYNYTTDVLGINNVIVAYDGNDTYAPTNRTAIFVVEQMPTVLTVNATSPIRVNSNTTISGRLVDATGKGLEGFTINITVGNDEYKYNATTDTDGYYTLNVTGEIEGEYTVKALFNGTEVYIVSNDTTMFKVNKHDVNIDLNVTNPKAGKTELNITFTDEGEEPVPEGNVVILDKDGNEIGRGVLDESGNLLTNITVEPGIQNITVVYEGTNNYTKANATYVINVPMYYANLTLENVNDTIVRNTTNITGFLLEEDRTPIADANITIVINGIEVANVTTGTDGNYSYVYDATTVGVKNVTVYYPGNATYSLLTANDTFNVAPIHTNITVPQIANTTIGGIVTINGTLTDELGQVVANVDVTVTVNGNNYTTSTDNEGYYTINYTTGVAGVNTVNVTFVGDNNILGTSNATTFNVTKIPTTTKANITIPRVGTNIVEINVTETDSGLNVTNGPLTITDEEGNVLATGQVYNGTSVIALDNLEAGKEYTFTVIYNGTNVYVNSSYVFNVKIPDHTLSVIPDPIAPVDVGESVNITGKILDENNNPLAETEINITVNGKTIKVTTDKNGTYKLPYITNTTGVNNVTISYNAEGYTPLEEKYNFTVNKISTQLTAEAITPIIVANNTTISGKLVDKHGNPIKEVDLIAYLNNEIFDTNIKTNDNGEYTFNITGEILGTNNVTVVYKGNGTYNGVNQTTNFVVQKLFTTISVETITPIKVGENTSITGKLVDINNNPLKDATVNITIDGQKYNTTTDSEGNYKFNITGRVLGDNNVTVFYEGSTVYMQTNNTGKFIVEKHNSEIQVIVEEPLPGKTPVNITITDEKGEIIPGGFVNITDENGVVVGNGTVDENGNLNTDLQLGPGTHKVTIKYNGTENSTPANRTITITVPAITTSLTLEDVADTEVRDNTTIKGRLSDAENKGIEGVNVTIYVDEDSFNVTTGEDGKFNLTYNATSSGEKLVEAIYEDDSGLYDDAYDDAKFNVAAINTKTTVNDISDTKIGEVLNITGVLKDYKDRTIPYKEIIITINGINYTTYTDENGNYSFEHVAVPAGETNVNVTFKGDHDFHTSNATTKFTIEKLDTTIESESVAASTGVNIIEVNLTDENDENIPFGPVYITDEDGNIIANGTIINGTVRVPVPTQPGDNKFKVVYNGTDKYSNATKDLTVTVPKYGTTVIPDPIPPVNIGETVNITGTIIDENNQPVRNTSINVTINGKNVTVKTDENGTYNVSYTTTITGINNVTVTLLENKNYTSSSTDSNFTVNKKTVTINPETPSIISGEPTVINGTIVGEDGKPVPGMKVNITINGENVTVTTNENGTYTYDYTFTTPGENNITITAYDEKGEYEPQTEEYKVYVDRKATQTLLDTPGTIKIGDKATITGQLLDDKGEPLANAPVTVTVGDKKVTVKTDKNGKYTAQVTPTTMGTNNITVTYPGNNTHKATNNTGVLYVDKLDTIITSNIANASRVDDNVIISGTLKDENGKALPKAPVTVNVNGKDFKTTTDNNGNYKVTYPSTTDGRHNVSIKYAGNGTHYPTEASRIFTLQKHDIIPSLNIVPGQGEITIVGNVTDENGKPIKDGNITITTPDGNKTVPVKDGKVNTTIPVTPGNNDIKMEIDAGDKYTPVTIPAVVDVPKINSKLTVDPLKPALAGDNVTVTGTLKDSKGKALPNEKVTVTCGNTTVTVTTDKDGKYQAVIPNISSGNKNVTVTYPGSNIYNVSTTQTTQSVTKRGTVVTVDPVVGIVGENITLTAYVKDANGAKVSGGNIVFKLNGRTLREDGRFDSDAPAMKLKVVDGKVTITLLADLYLRNAKNLTAMYSGSYKYDSNSSKVVTAQIQKRSATVKVTTTPTTVKQNTDIVFKATVTDVTKNHKNTTSVNQKGYVLFKLNGNTIKATNGSTLYVPVINSQATYTYHVPSGTGGITNDKNVRNYTVTAIYTNENFYPDNCKNTTTYNVLRSHVNVTITRAVVQDGLLSVKGTLKDDQGINVVGTSKVCVKINGATYKENGAYKYFTVTDGIVDISGIKANTKTQIKTVEVVSGERQAYFAGKGSTTNIIVIS